MKLKDLLSLAEIEFTNQKEFEKYTKQHKLRPDTKVKIAGKTTTAGHAVKKSGYGSKPGPHYKNPLKTKEDWDDMMRLTGGAPIKDKDGKIIPNPFKK